MHANQYTTEDNILLCKPFLSCLWMRPGTQGQIATQYDFDRFRLDSSWHTCITMQACDIILFGVPWDMNYRLIMWRPGVPNPWAACDPIVCSVLILRYVRCKAAPLRHVDAKGERIFNSDSFLTSALDGVNGQRHAPAPLYPREMAPRFPLNRRLGGPRAGL
jgi:hypothetical protein